MCRYLFVYGTLLPGLAAHSRIASLPSLGKGTMNGWLYELGDYPGAIPDPAAGQVIQGMVYELTTTSPSLLDRLDAYEGYQANDPDGSSFLRTSAHVRLANGDVAECWIYRYNRDVSRAVRIPHGDYLKWREENP